MSVALYLMNADWEMHWSQPGEVPPEAAEERKAVAQPLPGLVDARHTKVVRCLALELLSLAGDDAVVPQTAGLLSDADEEVKDQARRSLEGIPVRASLQALIAGLARSQGRLKLAIIASLGQRAAPEAAESLVLLTGTSDTEVVLAALDALARIGIPKDDRVTLPPWESLSSAQQSQLANSRWRWAEARAAKGAIDDALEAYRGILDHARSEHIVCAALTGAAKAAPDQALEYVVQALHHEENTVRVTAARILEAQSGDDRKNGMLLDAYRSGKPASRDLILRVLKGWNDTRLSS
jgi:HEAT repeat protein